jgi:crossover junction endodeoxyribonuclease RuvC
MLLTEDRIILGIDPGTNIMGYAVIKVQSSKFKDQSSKTKDKKIELIILDVIKLSHLKNQALKLKSIFETTLKIINEYKPDELAIEAQFFGKNVQSMLKLGRAQGVAIAAALYRDIPIHEYSPKKIKQSVTGKGNASKEQVAAMLGNLFPKSEISNTKSGIPLDATDALATAVCHYFQSREYGAGSSEKSSKKVNYTGWKAFVTQNPDRIK